MCIATVALVAAGTAVAGQVAGGIAQGNAAHYQAQVAANNATIARQNAAQAAAAGAIETEQAGLKTRQKQGNLRAALAANGVDVNSGSAADVQESERLIGATDQATVAHNAALRTYGFETQATGFDAQQQIDEAEAKTDWFSGLLKGAGQAAQMAPEIAGAGGGGAGPGGSSIFSTPGVYDAEAGGPMTSLLSGAPSIGSDYSWMSGNPTDVDF